MDTIYKKYSGEFIRSEYRTVMPVSDLNFNSPNNKTEFKLDHGDSFYNSAIQFHITGKLVKTDGSDYGENSTVKLVDNFPAFLFSRIEVRKHNTLIDTVEHPGITSTVKALVGYSNSQKQSLASCGFVSKFQGGGNFEALGRLGHLGLGFFDHLKYPMFKGGFEITFIRSENNDAIYHWKGTGTGATDPGDGKVVINSFMLRVPLVEYSAESTVKLINELKTISDKGSLIYNYLQWQCIEKKGVTGSSLVFDITNAYRNVFNPRFVMIAFQRDRLDTQSADPSKFDSQNMKNVIVKINREVYPQELQNLDITNKKYRVLYDMYQNFRRVSFRDENVFLDEASFIKDYAIAVVDTTLHPVTIDKSKSDIQIEVDFTNTIGTSDKSGTIAYVVVVSETSFTYDITRNIIRFY